jgi:hypothetical protein
MAAHVRHVLAGEERTHRARPGAIGVIEQRPQEGKCLLALGLVTLVKAVDDNDNVLRGTA